jgi:hypothetical protein
MYSLKPHLIWVFALLANACNISSLDEVVIPEVNDEFYLDIWENLSPEGRSLEWQLRTIENAECEGASLNYSYRQLASSIELVINEINNPADCAPAEQPLEVSIDAGTLAVSTYPLSFSLRATVTNEGTLSVDDDKYILDFDKPVGIRLQRRELLRIPDKVIWGYVHTAHDSLEMAAESWTAQFAALCVPASLKTGYYGYFVLRNGDIILNNELVPVGASQFAYELVADKSELEALLTTYRNQYPEGLDIKIFNTKGEEL